MVSPVLDEDALAAIVAAVGNHEGKALTYLAMDPDEEYGVSSLHRLFLAVQGETPAFVGVTNLQQKYATYSYQPAGLIETSTNEKGSMRYRKVDAGGLATPIAGHILATTEDLPPSLTQILGPSQKKASATTSPVARRLRILRALARADGPVYTAEVAHLSGVHETAVGQTADGLATAGLIEYTTGPTYKFRSRYRVTKPITPTRRGNVALEAAIADLLNDRLTKAPGGYEIPHDEIETHVRALPRWSKSPQLRDQVQRVMVRLAARNAITPLEAYAGQTHHTAISISEQHRNALRNLIDGLDAIAAGDPAALAAGTQSAKAIVADPERARRLVSRAYGANKIVTNPLTRVEKQDRVLAALAERDAVTSEQLLAAVGDDLNKTLLGGTLGELARAHLVRGETQPDGPYKLWYLEPGAWTSAPAPATAPPDTTQYDNDLVRRTGVLLSALGREIRALTYAAMRAEVAYGAADLRELVVGLAGSDKDIPATRRGHQRHWLRSCYLPAGIVTMLDATRCSKNDRDGRATALAGHLLALSEELPVSINVLIGPALLHGELHGERSPGARRLSAILALLDTDQPHTQNEISRRADLRLNGSNRIYHDLADSRLITVGEVMPTEGAFVIKSPIGPPAPESTAAERHIAGYINRRYAASKRQVTITAQEVAGHLSRLGADPDTDVVQTIRDLAPGAEAPCPATRRTRATTQVSVNDEQRALLARFARGTVDIVAGDSDAIRQGTDQAAVILADPERTGRLLAKDDREGT